MDVAYHLIHFAGAFYENDVVVVRGTRAMAGPGLDTVVGDCSAANRRHEHQQRLEKLPICNTTWGSYDYLNKVKINEMKSVGAFYKSDKALTHGKAGINDENHYRLLTKP